MSASVCRPTRVEVDLDAVVANFREIRRFARGSDVWPVVKADAYGHGAARVVRALRREPLAGFCVATATEGREVRTAGASQPVLVMGGLWEGGAVDAFGLVVEYGLSGTVQDLATAERLAEASREQAIGPASVWLKIDTGMGRLGALPTHAVELAAAVYDDPALSLDGLFSNLATADSTGDTDGAAYVDEQLEAWRRVCAALEREGLLPRHRTLANSAGALQHPGTREHDSCTGIRPGLALYGATLNSGADPVELRPAMRLVSALGAVRDLPDGAYVGYDLTWRAARDTRVGVLPVGYHDGVPRALSNQGHVMVRGRRAPIIGRISMDLTLVDVTDVPGAREGDEVVLFGPAARAAEPESRDSQFAAMLEATMSAVEAAPGSGNRHLHGGIGVEEMAAAAGTIPHEILCRVGARVPRVYRDDDRAEASAAAGSGDAHR